VELRKREGIGALHCKICGQHFESNINYLSAPIDVYSDWIDACEQVAREEGAARQETARDDDDDY